MHQIIQQHKPLHCRFVAAAVQEQGGFHIYLLRPACGANVLSSVDPSFGHTNNNKSKAASNTNTHTL
jgi:hypothetical protein